MNEEFLKLTDSVYKLLEFFPESDPLKNKAKNKALEIMEHPTKENIDILLGYLWIGKNQGWLNSVNCLIVINEYQKIKPAIEPIISQEPVLNNEGVLKRDAPSTFIKNPDIPDRQKIILEFLSKNGKAQVMDLQTVLPNITKRTIRRDLDELLQTGKIERMGEFNQVFYKIKR